MENQQQLMNTIGPMYIQEKNQQGLRLVDKDGNEVTLQQ
jgi:hypothetical protein